MVTGFKQKQVLFFIIAAIVVATFVAYEPIRHNDFVDYDDNAYVRENPNVNGGITLQSIKWAFTKYHASNWHPLTWLSHMLDCEIYGLKPVGHHITNVLIHIANSLLLLLLLWKMTGAMWRSAFVAGAFALHPVHVESVAWLAERKDVLSGLFWMLTILAYIYYARRPNVRRYTLVLLTFVMGLLSKPMVVTLPLVLLLLDYWPLERLRPRGNNPLSEQKDATSIYQKVSMWQAIAEKAPMVALSAISSVITIVAQQSSGTVASLEGYPLGIRITDSLGCYFNYIVKILYPKGLTFFYPPPEKATADAAMLAIMGVALLLALWGKGRRWLVVGLLWYLVTLVPVIGLVQVGAQSMADRYTYLPSIGVFIIIAWGATEILAKLSIPKPVTALAGSVLIIVMVLATRIQVGYWKDSPSLCERSLAVTKNNYVVQYGYGIYLSKQKQYEKAMQHLRESVRIRPGSLKLKQSICAVLLAQNKSDEAISCFTSLLQEKKNWPEMYMAYHNLGLAYEQKGDLAMAEVNYRKALMLQPDYARAQNSLLSVLAKQGKTQ